MHNKELLIDVTLATIKHQMEQYPAHQTHSYEMARFFHINKNRENRSLEEGQLNSRDITNNLIPLEIEYSMTFLLTNLIFYELFCLVCPNEIRIDLIKLVSSKAIYYAFHVPSGKCLTSPVDIF